MTAYEISNGHVFLLVTGGCNEYDQSDDKSFFITGSDVVIFVELGNIYIYIYIHNIINKHSSVSI